jgi:hypothetical protein
MMVTVPCVGSGLLQWIKGRRPARNSESEAGAANAEPSVVSGRSGPLHKYLDGRYADAVVLTFGEIEDLIGFALPELARVSKDWWTTPDPDTTRFADSWKQARRTARPNLRALTVAFDRTF